MEPPYFVLRGASRSLSGALESRQPIASVLIKLRLRQSRGGELKLEAGGWSAVRIGQLALHPATLANVVGQMFGGGEQ